MATKAGEHECLLRGCLFRDSSYYSMDVYSAIRKTIFVSAGVVAVILLIFLTLTFYPFKTVILEEPIPVLNENRTVQLGGVVRMRMTWEKFTNSPGLVVRTLIRKKGNETIVLDSSTIVSTRKAGAGTTEGIFLVMEHHDALSEQKDDCVIVFSIYHTVFGVRTIARQFVTQPFTIVAKK